MLFVNCILFDDVDISIDGSILIVSMIGLKVPKYRIVNVRRKEDTYIKLTVNCNLSFTSKEILRYTGLKEQYRVIFPSAWHDCISAAYINMEKTFCTLLQPRQTILPIICFANEP